MRYSLLRPAFFALPPETAHDMALKNLSWATRLHLLPSGAPHVPLRLWGHDLPNPVGLAAGLDKNGDYINGLSRLGFGMIEIGTITPRPQAGNPKPRLFRLPRAQALINRMGFNNKGVDHLVGRLREHRFNGLLGVNIGKNKDTPNENAVDDYVHCMNKVYAHAGYITINLSSPNTAGLRDLQAPAMLNTLLKKLDQARHRLADQHGRRVPLVVKVAPDLNPDDIPGIAEVLINTHIDGLIATNTTIQRPAVDDLPHGAESGGLSGAPLKSLADQTLARFHQHLPKSIVRIGCGGITQGADAADKIRLGANMVQIYSGLIYRGPGLIAEATKAMQPLVDANAKR